MRLYKSKYISIAIVIMAVAFMSARPYLMFLGTLASINAIAVLGINIISGYTGQLHLGQAAFVGLGAYTSALLVLRLGLSFWLSLPFAIILAAIFGILLGIPALKLRGGPYLALVTQTFGEIIYILLLNMVALTGGPFGLPGINPPHIGPIQFTGLRAYFFLCVAFLGVSFVVCRQIVNSRFGRAFISIKESEAAAQSIGINTMKYKIMAFAIAAAFGGVAGTLYGPFIGYISPDQFRWLPSLSLISMAIVGGLSSVVGGVIGAFVVTFLPEMLRIAQEFRLILYSLLLIFTLTFLPDGLISVYGMQPRQISTLFKDRMKELTGKAKQAKG
jgi:branched-chain amino acid transport system permease protein